MRAALVISALAAAMTLPATASAADFYVDKETGNNTNDCSSPALACDTIQRGVTFAGFSGTGHTIHVDDSATPYSEGSVSLFNDFSVVGDSSVAGSTSESPGGRPIAETVSGQVFFVGGPDSAGTISGFVLRPNNGAGIVVSGDADEISGNLFEDPGASGNDIGVSVGGSGSVVIRDNDFTDLSFGVSVPGGATPLIEDNVFSGTRNGNAIEVGLGSPTVIGNVFQNPGAGNAQHVRLGTTGPTAAIAATFRRNKFLDTPTFGVNVNDAAGPVTFDGDLISGAGNAGIVALDSDDNGDSEISATNVTIVSEPTAAGEINLTDSLLTLDSSILGDLGVAVTGGSACTITFSRGPVSVPGGNGCQNFQTTADPLFVNAPADDFHLQAASPMIDAGNPAAPPVGTLDLDGDARVLEGDAVCPIDPRRDIGADELAVAPPDCTPPPPPPGTGTPAPKKCKKGQKLKKGKCVKKKKRRKR